MSRRVKTAKRGAKPDHKFHDQLIALFVSCLLKRGKRSTAEHCFYAALDLLEKKTGQSGRDVFHKAMENVKPTLEVKSRRVGGATYQVPVEVRPSRRIALSMRWLVEYARNRGEKSMRQRLAGEIIDASQGKGNAVKKREDVHRMADANRAFSHYRF